jgi:hypothetical protein
MPSLTSIPGYLLKNTLRRWLENPASPITKLLIPFLFAVLSLLVFGIFQHLEQQIRAQLERDDLRMIRTQESIYGHEAAQRVAQGTNDEHFWGRYCHSFTSLQQTPLVGRTRLYKQVPVLAYDKELPSMIEASTPPNEARPIVLLSNHPHPSGNDYAVILDTQFDVQTQPIPKLLSDAYPRPAILLIPAEIIEPVLERGFTHIQLLQPKPDVSPERLVDLLRTHAYAEKRDVLVYNSLSLIEQLNQLLSNQQGARLLIALVVFLILSLTLAALSLLEFRQESYLFALLRSFGVRSFSLLLHYLVETSVLTFGGIAAAMMFCRHTLPGLVTQHSQLMGGQMAVNAAMAQPSTADYRILFLAAGLGILFSAIPVALGLRKPAGLYLP